MGKASCREVAQFIKEIIKKTSEVCHGLRNISKLSNFYGTIFDKTPKLIEQEKTLIPEIYKDFNHPRAPSNMLSSNFYPVVTNKVCLIFPIKLEDTKFEACAEMRRLFIYEL